MNLPLRCQPVVVCVLSLSIGLANQLASAQGMRNPGPALVDEDQEQILSYWTAQGGWRSELQLRNNLPAQDLTVTPVLRDPDGSETPLPALTIKPQEVRTVDLNIAINSFAPYLSGSYGSVALRYRAYDNRNLYAAIMVHDTGHPIAFHIDASGESSNYDAGSREGIWWLPNDTAKDILVLTNQGNRPLELALSIYDASGKEARQQISLKARQTGIYSVRQYVESGHLTGGYGGIRVRALEHGGSLDTLHAVYDETAGFSALLKMFDRDPAAKIESRDFARTSLWTQRAPMLALSIPDPALNFPLGTILQPQLFVRNAANRKVTAKLRFVWRNANATGKVNGPTLVLGLNETRRIDVGVLQNNGALPADAQWASVILTSDGPPDEIFAVAASYDTTLRYGAQTPFSDQLASNWVGGQWEVDTMHDSIITAGNGGTKPARADFTLFYNQGQSHYELEQTLQPDEQMWLDIRKLIRDQVPDKSGNTLPPDLAFGSYRIRDLTHPAVGSLFEGKVIYDTSFGHVSYGCAACCAERAARVIYNPFYTLMGLGYANGVEATDSCGGIDDLSPDFYNWDTANHAIATTTKSGTHTGVSIGSTTSSTNGDVLATNGRNGCYLVPAAPSGPTNVATLNCTSSVTRGGSATCTVSGPTGTAVSGWNFKDGSGNTVTRSTNTTNLSWQGTMVTSGTVSVTAGQNPLTASITVNNRTNFAFTAVNPSQSSGNSITCYNGTTTILTSPPTNNQDEGASCADLSFSYQVSAAISDGGPNNGYQYVTSVSDSYNGQPTKYQYIVVSDLLSATTFYNAQCGTFSSSNTSGFIAGSQLKQNVFDHEQGPVFSHWTEYVSAQNSSNNNIGTVLEQMVGSPGLSQSTFNQNVNTAGTNALNAIYNAASNEPCSGLATNDSSQACKNCGVINVGPSYASCNGAQPVAYCQ